MKGLNIMTLISSTRLFNGALLAGATALISTEVAVAQPAPGTADSAVRTDSLGLLTADLYCPDRFYYPPTVPVFGSAQSIPEPEKP